MPTTKWDAAWTDRGTVLDTQMNSLATNARTEPGTEVANQTNLDKYGKLELTVDFASAPGAGGTLYLFMVTAPDGTNYADGSGSVDPGNHTLVSVLPVRVDANPQRLMSHVFDLEPSKTKFLLLNQTDQIFPASGSVLKLYTQNDETA